MQSSTSFIVTVVCCVAITVGLALQMDRGFVTLSWLRIDREQQPVLFWTWSIVVAVMLVTVAAGSAWLFVNESKTAP